MDELSSTCMTKKPQPLHPALCKALGFPEGTPAREALAKWDRRARSVCKPCWELKYCPYGRLVEEFPNVPATTAQVAEWIEGNRTTLASGVDGAGEPLSEHTRKVLARQIRHFKTHDYPESVPRAVAATACTVFGHICPVFFVGSGFTETREERRQTRSISRETMLQVIRRDGQICQACHRPVPDNEVEFDHIIPYSRGGTTTAHNLRLVHRNCNRTRGASLKELLEDPNELLRELQKLESKKVKKG